MISSQFVAAAVLDQALSDGDSGLLSARLLEKGIPFLVYSGLPDNALGPHSSAPALADLFVVAVGELQHSAPAGKRCLRAFVLMTIFASLAGGWLVSADPPYEIV